MHASARYVPALYLEGDSGAQGAAMRLADLQLQPREDDSKDEVQAAAAALAELAGET